MGKQSGTQSLIFQKARKMKSFRSYIIEVFDTRLKWKYQKSKSGVDTKHEFTANHAGSEILLTIEEEPGVVAEIYFERDGRMDATKQGNSAEIFGAVLNKIVEWLNAQPVKPKQIYFVASDPQKGTRESLYDKMIKRYAGKLGYTSRKFSVPQHGHTSYYLDLKKDN
jgi:hypothetical protein